MHVSKLLTHHLKFLWVHISIETLTETQGNHDNEPKVPEQVGHRSKVEFYPRTCHEHPGRELTYNYIIYLNSAVDGLVSPTSRPGRCIPGKKTRDPFCWRLRGHQGRPGRVRTISLLTEVRSPVLFSRWRVAIPTKLATCRA